jgi:hypothetical protein
MNFKITVILVLLLSTFSKSYTQSEDYQKKKENALKTVSPFELIDTHQKTDQVLEYEIASLKYSKRLLCYHPLLSKTTKSITHAYISEKWSVFYANIVGMVCFCFVSNGVKILKLIIG